MNVESKGLLYHNESNGYQYYSISDGSKNVDGSWTNKAWNVRFKKDTPVPDHKSKISFKGFMSYYEKEYKGKKEVMATIQITEWEYLEQPKDDYDYVDYGVKTEADEPFADSKKIDVSDDLELPF